VIEVTQVNLEHVLPSEHWQHLVREVGYHLCKLCGGEVWLTGMTKDVTETIAVARQLLEVVIVYDILQ